MENMVAAPYLKPSLSRKIIFSWHAGFYHTLPYIESMFGGFGCKCQLLEPHFAIFSLHSAAMKLKNAFVRTQNLTFSLQKHHLQTCSEPHKSKK